MWALLFALALATCAPLFVDATNSTVNFGAGGYSTEKSEVSLRALFDLIRANREEDRVRWEALKGDVATLKGDVATLAGAVVTPAAAELVHTCSTGSVLFLESRWDTNKWFKHCSAVPLFMGGDAEGAGDSTTFFLSSAHCFINVYDAEAAPATVALLVFRGAVHTCTLLHSFFKHSAPGSPHDPASADLAIVRCPAPVAIAPPKLSVLKRHPSLRIAVVGYSPGLHVDRSLTLSMGAGTNPAALHVRFASLTLSLQTPLALSPAHAALDVSSVNYTASTADWVPHHMGYLDIVPEQGMSGGAVVDMQCGLLGITAQRSAYGVGGGFVELSAAVVGLVKAAVAAARSAR